MNKENYKLNKNVTQKQLHDFGFRNNTYKTYLYKKQIQLVVKVDLDEKWWSYMVIDTDTGELYPSYYNRKYGINNLVPDIDKKISILLKQMEDNKILYRKDKKKKRNGKQDSRIQKGKF